ncbi:hypothetical protein [Streptomyces sp. NPDC005385]|uniref:hypothetical protein n=1 Tax=Streptomyces sp. NPDC005385 TaxID=3157039 RepID=UPI0033B9C398
MTDRDLTRRRVLALGGAAVGAALGIGLSSCGADPEPDASPHTSPRPGDGTAPKRPDGRAGAEDAEDADGN